MRFALTELDNIQLCQVGKKEIKEKGNHFFLLLSVPPAWLTSGWSEDGWNL